jgi:hypothetical protein
MAKAKSALKNHLGKQKTIHKNIVKLDITNDEPKILDFEKKKSNSKT